MISSLRQCFEYILDTIAQHIQRWVKLENPSLSADAVFDLTRSKSELMIENAFLRQQLIVLNRQVKRVPGHGWTFADPKTKKVRRTIKLGDEILKLLRAHKKRQEAQKVVIGELWVENGLIFPSSIGTPLNQSNLRKDFLKDLDRAKLPKIRFHDLRHTAASLMLNNGVPPIVVSNRLGHSKPSITMDVYGHLYQEMQSDAAKIMDDLVMPIKLDMRELETHAAVKGRNVVHISE